LIVVVLSAAFLGMVHSLAPAHWLPVVLVARAKRWALPTAVAGALTAGAAHILVTVALGALGAFAGVRLLADHGEAIERLSGAALAAFGAVFAGWSYRRHRRCGPHGHHGPRLERILARPFLMLFALGFTPCLSVIPVFVAAAPYGVFSIALTAAAFCCGVLLTLGAATWAATTGLMNLDIPILEHHGDVVAGVGIAVAGGLLASGLVG